MPNENDNKLITLADLAEAYMALYNRDVMTSADKTKLDGIETGAQVNTITGVKGNAESSYRTGNVDLTPANIGAVAKTGDTMTGLLTIDRSAQGDQSRILFTSPGASGVCQIVGNTTGNQQRITFRQYVPDGSSYEEYALPNTADYTGGNVLRNILTDKSPVTIGQGGTGATTPAGARANLHAMQNPDSSIEMRNTGNLNDAPAGFSVWAAECVNNPFDFWASALTISVGSGYIQQIVFPWKPSEMRIGYRVCDGGTWHPWRYITMN